jgi:hypothetical protein
VADPEVVDCNLMSCPGLTHNGLVDHLNNVCEDRGDALAIVDLDGGYVPFYENTSAETSRMGSVDTVVANLKSRSINTSYSCAYYPWLQVKDTINGASVWVPPSVAMLGVFASSEAKSELWMAPAGFTRGGLTDGAAGIPVTAVRERLKSKQRDKLYEASINPIASFPNEGIVVFGNKTLKTTASALDRVNVRRMVIYVEKEISRIASRILFEQNVKETWTRFRMQAEPFLRSVKARYGLADYRLQLDESTTTPDLIDRNTIYGRVFLIPEKSVEFIALDFNISNRGASFAG